MTSTSFWIENISHLFQWKEGFLPHSQMSLEAQLNSLSRFVILLFLFLFGIQFPYDIHFLSTSLFLIILIYYTFQWFFVHSSHKTIQESYGKVESVLVEPPDIQWNSDHSNFIFGSTSPVSSRSNCPSSSTPCSLGIPMVDNLQWVDTASSNAWCQPSSYPPIQKTFSVNQQLAGPPNPRTLVQPIIPNPIYDFETWVPNDFVIPTGINDQKRQELFQNGYVSSVTPSFHVKESYSQEHPPAYPNQYNSTNYNVSYPTIDTSCGYSPDNLSYNLPINYQANRCQKSNSMRDYNQNLFSIPLQPNIYTFSQVNQPYASMSNLGISETNPFPPMIPSYEPSSQLQLFNEYAPSQVEPVQIPPYQSEYYGRPLRNEIYDPRLTGYGTSYRSYVDKMTGQPRFYYDDIDQQTQPNYITRNKLDIYGFASQVGPFKESTLEGNQLREAANQNFTDNTLLFRTELQQRLMHKNNSREWQQRQAPIRTQTTFTRNGGTMM